jgi:hypothetical protein
VAAHEILLSVDVAVPLAAIRSVLVTFVFDNDLESQIDKIDSSDRTVVVASDDIALRCWQICQYQTQSQVGLAR